NMKTNMTYKEMKSFFGYLTKGTGIDIDTLSIDGVDYQPGNVYYWQLDDRSLAKNINIMEEHLEIPVTDFGYDFSEMKKMMEKTLNLKVKMGLLMSKKLPKENNHL